MVWSGSSRGLVARERLPGSSEQGQAEDGGDRGAGGDGYWALGLFALGNAGLAAGVVISSINTRTHRQVASPPELLSRVMATVRFVSWGVIPVGALAAGGLATWTSPRTALWVFCAVNLVSPLILWASAIRSRRDLVD